MSDINAILRDGSNVNMPALRAFLADLEGSLAQTNLAIATGTITALVDDRTYATRAALYADLAPAANLFALVYADSDPLKNGLYQKSGATGGGSWTGPFDLFSSAAEALVQGLVDDAEAAALAAADSAAELSDLNAATTGMISPAIGPALGVFPLVSTADDFNQNTHALIARATSDGSLGEVGVRIRFVGSGNCSITIARGDGPDLTFVSNTALPTVSATGSIVFDEEDLAGITVQEGDAILFTTPVGGVAGMTLASSGHTLLFKVGSFSSGTETFTTASNTKLNAYVKMLAPTLKVPRTGLVDESLLNTIEPLAAVADPVVAAVGMRADATGLFPLSRGVDQFNAGNTALLYSATEAANVTEVGIWSDNIGSGDINLVVASGTLPDLTFVSSAALTDATLTGPNKWTVDVDLTAGQHLLLSVPSGGVNQMTTAVSGQMFRYATGTFTSGSKTMVTASDTRFHGYVKAGVPGVQIARADLAPALAGQIVDISLPSEWDMFLCIGQSNAVGSAGGVVDTVSIPAGVMKQYYSGALTDKTADPVGNASNNSALPAFALEYWRRTGRGVIFVPAASGSTALVAAADAGSGNWSATGTLRGSAITLLNAAKAAANSAGLAWKFAGAIWCQGEQDAVAIDSATITKANYTTELGTLLTYMQTQTGSGSTMPFIISVIGSRTVAGGGDTTGFQQIRAAQIEFAAGRPNVFIGFTAAKTFVARNLMWDGVHYSARGYDEMGRALASVAAVACAGRA